MPARRKYFVPSGLKPVSRRLATGEVRVYWYHRATGKRLSHDPTSLEGLLEVKTLDDRAKVASAITATMQGTYADLWAKYRDSPEWRSLKPRTRSDYQAVRDWLGEPAEKRLLSALTTPEVLRLRDKAASTKGRRFGNYVVQVMRLTFTWGRLRGHVKDNPAKDVKLIRRPSGTPHVNRSWRLEEVEAFFSGAPFQLTVPMALGLFAGMRQGDALRVTWAAYEGVTLRWIASKNGERCAAPVTGEFKKILDAAKARRGKALQIAVTSTGTPWSESGFRASFFKRLRNLRDSGAIKPGCTFHGLRHTIGANARNDGESDFRVSAAIGDRTTAQAAVYGRDADRESAQAQVLAAGQKRFVNIDWKTPSV